MTAVKFKSAYADVRSLVDYDSRTDPSGIDCSHDPVTGELTPSLTKQEFAAESDINVIMARYEATGELRNVNGRAPQWGDATSVMDFQSALNTVLKAEADFAALPARVRDRFGNDPAQLLAFLGDEKNRDEAISLGLVDRPADPPPPTEVRIVDPPKQAAAPAASGGPGGTPA